MPFKTCKGTIHQLFNYSRTMKPITSINSIFICRGENVLHHQCHRLPGCYKHSCLTAVCCCSLLLPIVGERGQRGSGDGHVKKINVCFQGKAECWRRRILKLLDLPCCGISQEWAVWRKWCPSLIAWNRVIIIICKTLQKWGNKLLLVFLSNSHCKGSYLTQVIFYLFAATDMI